jgi:hypothetical protein
VAYALQGAGIQVDIGNTTPGFDFIATPIQRLFRDLPQDLTSILRVLCVLGIRFERTYLHSREMKWSQPFSIVFSFLEDILNSTSSSDFARTLTTTDEREFTGLIDQGSFDEDLARRLSVRWEKLSIDVWECCKALPKMIEYIQESLQVGVHLPTYQASRRLTVAAPFGSSKLPLVDSHSERAAQIQHLGVSNGAHRQRHHCLSYEPSV